MPHLVAKGNHVSLARLADQPPFCDLLSLAHCGARADRKDLTIGGRYIPPRAHAVDIEGGAALHAADRVIIAAGPVYGELRGCYCVGHGTTILRYYVRIVK